MGWVGVESGLVNTVPFMFMILVVVSELQGGGENSVLEKGVVQCDWVSRAVVRRK